MRKNSLSVIHMKKPRQVEIISPASLIKRAIQNKLAIAQDDPAHRQDYNCLVLKDKDLKKRVYSEIKSCRTYYNNQK